MERKNIVIIMSDEQSWNTLGEKLYPVSVTPQLDQLASEGVSVNGCYTTYPLCCPARASLWCGWMPHAHRVTDNWRSIREELKDEGLVKPFKNAGYHTIYTGKWHVPGTTPARMHFSESHAIPEIIDGKDRGRFIKDYRDYAGEQGYQLHPTHPENLTEADIHQLQQAGMAPCGRSEIAEEHFLETWQTGVFLEALDRRPVDEPFFAVCSYNAPHFPMIVPAPFDELVRPEDIILPENFLKGWKGKPEEVLNSPYFQEMKGLDEWQWRRFIAHYLGLCALIDKQVGRIVEYLQEQEVYNDTLIVFLSDHGDMMGAHGLVKKGFELHYEEALRVPMIFRGGGIAAGMKSQALVSLVDLLPTLAEWVNVSMEQKTDGRSFAHVIENPDVAEHRAYVIAETFKMAGDQFDPAIDKFNLSLRTPRFKYIFRYRDQEELYNLSEDPYENNNLAGSASGETTISELRKQLWQEMRKSAPWLGELIASKWAEQGKEELN